jgi:hypothetical protein
MKNFLSLLNRVVTVLNALLVGLGAVQIIHLGKWQQKKIPLWLNLILFCILGFLVFCFYYAPYLRDKAA